jgi:iron complex outermembrane receptor protein
MQKNKHLERTRRHRAMSPASTALASADARHHPCCLPLAAMLAACGLLTHLSAQAQTADAPAAPSAAASAPAAQQQRKPATPPAPTAKPATPSAEQLERVEVSGGASDTSLRRASTASKIVVGREEIERFGDASVAEVLKRLPGVTTGGRPGRGGGPRMRGMGAGYTQVLVNGERMPAGFSLDDLPPEQVERIEVMRAPTAEFGARAVAGTINIVLREALVKRNNDLRVGIAHENGVNSPDFSWTRNDTLAEDGNGAYTLTVVANDRRRRDDIDIRTTTLRLDRQESSSFQQSGFSENERQSLNVNARIQWRLGGGDSLNLMPILVAAKGSNSSQFSQVPTRDYDFVQTSGDGQFRMARLNGQWNKRIDDSTRFELRGGLGQAKLDSNSLRQEYLGQPGALLPSHRQDDTTNSLDRSWSSIAKLSHQMDNSGEHSLVGGLEAEGVKRDQTRISLLDGLPRAELADFGDNLQASTLRLAAYAQDEFQLSKQWSAYAGLRWEGIRTESSALAYQVRNSSSVWTPLLHTVWKLDEKSRDQIRVSLTRSYRAPDVQALIAKPSINAQYQLDPDTGSYPDRAGNPDLKPELATGIDVALERYLSKGGILSVSAFARRIKDLIRNVTALETVSWSDTPRWVQRPRNIGEATTMGIELEAKFRLDEFIDDALPVSVRSNLSLFRSSVDGIPGPNNRLDAQPRGTANLGADYRLRSMPLSLGASINFTPATTIQQTTLLESKSTRKQVIDAFALWSFNRDVALRLTASNLGPLDYTTTNTISTARLLTTTDTAGRTFTNWQARLEIKL